MPFRSPGRSLASLSPDVHVFVSCVQYRQLCQCETLDDVKLCLGDTDYLNVLQNSAKLTPEIVLKRCEDKFVAEYQFLQSQAVGPLATFLDMITYEELISNISFIITSLIKGSDPAVLLQKCLPLGRSPHLKAVMTSENTDTTATIRGGWLVCSFVC